MVDPTAIPVLPEQVVSERTRLAIPSMPNWIEPTIEFLRQKAVLAGACGETRSGKLMIALHEAVTNAIVHGNLGISSALKERPNNAFAEALAQRAADESLSAREVDIVIDFDGEICRWIITDQGDGFDVDDVVARCTSDDPELFLASGRGILMMKSFLDDVRYDLGGRRVILSLVRESGREKRKDTRMPLTAPFKVTPVRADGTPLWTDTYDALSFNLSENGVGLLQRQLAHAANVLIGIPTDQGIVHVPAAVKHAKPLGATGMELGCQFDSPAALPSVTPTPRASAQMEEVHHAVADLLDSYAARQVAPHERRVHQRIVFTERIVVRLEDRDAPLVAYARDLSRGGIAFIAEEPLPEHVTVELPPGADGTRLRIRCRVVRCSLIQEGFYDVGATFERLAAHD